MGDYMSFILCLSQAQVQGIDTGQLSDVVSCAAQVQRIDII
jgi:hypothetical protein